MKTIQPISALDMKIFQEEIDPLSLYERLRYDAVNVQSTSVSILTIYYKPLARLFILRRITFILKNPNDLEDNQMRL